MAGVKGRSGGARPGAGRKPRVTEEALTGKLSPLDDLVFEKLKAGIKNGDFRFIKIFFEYRYGKPQQSILTEDVTEKYDPIGGMSDEEIRSQTDRLMLLDLASPGSRFHQAIRNLYGITERKYLTHADLPERTEKGSH